MSPRVLLLAALITAFAPLSMDLYLPGLPDLRQDFGATENQAQLTVTGCIVGLALGQLLVGVVPERLGRRRPLLIGIAVWIVATLICSFAPNIWLVLLVRIIQGAGAGVAIALARAVVADLDPRNLSTHLSRMMLVLSVVPILAPALGGLAMSFTGWRGLFLILGLVGALLFVVVFYTLAESYQPASGAAARPSAVAPMVDLLRSPAFMLPALVSGTGFGVMFSYIGESSFLFRDHFGLAPAAYGVLFGVNAAALIAGFQIGPILERRFGARSTLQLAAVTGGAGASIMAAAGALLPSAIVPVVGSLMMVLFAAGIVNPVATATAIDSHPDEIGAGSGLSGALQFFVGGLIGTLPALLPLGDGAQSLGTVCLACFVLGCLGCSRLVTPAPAKNDDVLLPIPACSQL